MTGKEKNAPTLEAFDTRTNPDFIIGSDYKDLIADLSEELNDDTIDFAELVCEVFIYSLAATCKSVAKFSNKKLESDRNLYKNTPKNFKFMRAMCSRRCSGKVR